jgi:NAD(P)H dehydrogenase (quinone)
MTILSVYAHHEASSLTSSLKNITISVLSHQGHTVIESDLYGSGFAPKAEKYDFTTTGGKHFNYMLEQKHAQQENMGFAPDIVAELEKLAQADVVIFHAPLWWFSVPAVLKGWFDRVLAMGVAWDGGKIYENGLLRGKKAMLCVVAGGPEEYFRVDGKHKATMQQILHPIHHGTLAFCGFDVLEPFIVLNSLGKTPQEIESLLGEYQFKVEHLIDSPTYFHKFD